VTEKSNRQLDRDAFRPLGEGSITPDHNLRDADGVDPDDHLDSEAYPARTDGSGTCRGCRAEIPPGRSKCSSCLREHVEPLDEIATDPARDWSFCHLIFAVVEAGTDYSAVAKGTAACTQLVERDDDPIANYQSVAEFRESPSTFLTSRWGDLPAATRVDSDAGQRLLARIRERRAEDHGQELSDDDTSEVKTEAGNDAVHDTYLYDRSGDGIRTVEAIETVRTASTDPLWLIPAIGLLPASSIGDGGRASRREPLRGEFLRCHSCNEETVHHCVGTQPVSDPSSRDTPLWRCGRCATPRFGPSPHSNG